MRRILWLLVTGLAFAIVICLGLKVWNLNRPDRGITPQAFERIQVGKTEEEVERILGCPAGDNAPEYERAGFVLVLDLEGMNEQEWRTRRYMIRVIFVDVHTHFKDDDVTFYEGPPTLMDRVMIMPGF